jgi:hypothetical protein
VNIVKLREFVTMKITGQIIRAAIVGQADKYKRFAEQCREMAKPLGGQFKQTLDEMAQDWDDLACQEDKDAKSHEKAPAAMSDRA